jgi:hypothetical protein
MARQEFVVGVRYTSFSAVSAVAANPKFLNQAPVPESVGMYGASAFVRAYMNRAGGWYVEGAYGRAYGSEATTGWSGQTALQTVALGYEGLFWHRLAYTGYVRVMYTDYGEHTIQELETTTVSAKPSGLHLIGGFGFNAW